MILFHDFRFWIAANGRRMVALDHPLKKHYVHLLAVWIVFKAFSWHLHVLVDGAVWYFAGSRLVSLLGVAAAIGVHKVLVLQPILAAIVTSLGSLRGQVYPSLLKWAVPFSLSRCWQIIEDYLVHVCTRGRLGFGSLIFWCSHLRLTPMRWSAIINRTPIVITFGYSLTSLCQLLIRYSNNERLFLVHWRRISALSLVFGRYDSLVHPTMAKVSFSNADDVGGEAGPIVLLCIWLLNSHTRSNLVHIRRKHPWSFLSAFIYELIGFWIPLLLLMKLNHFLRDHQRLDLVWRSFRVQLRLDYLQLLLLENLRIIISIWHNRILRSI